MQREIDEDIPLLLRIGTEKHNSIKPKWRRQNRHGKRGETMAVFTTKYDLGQEVYYGYKDDRRKGEIITIYFDGTFDNIPKYEIEYNGNVWAEDDISDKE